LRRALAVFAALAASQACAGDARWYVQVDNDVVAGTDRWYTSGVRIARVSAPGPVETEWGILQEIFTPEAKYWAPGIDDRAPTARLLAYGGRHWLEPSAFSTVEIALGVRGPSALGEEVTRAIHKVISAPKVDWSRQESDRFDGHVAAVRTLRFGPFNAHLGGVVGTEQVFAHGGIEWRFGDEAASGASSPAMRFAATPPPSAREGGWGGFIGANIRGVGRNEMIRVNYDPAGPEVEPKRAVARAMIGLAGVQRWGSVTFAVVGESREFDAQRKAHTFGSLTVSVDF
jgi:lipid A 3-O-deacylase